MQMPSEVRPHRPLRWFADACETGSIGSRCTLVLALYREIRAVPGSITYLTPGTVSEVTATIGASAPGREKWPAKRPGSIVADVMITLRSGRLGSSLRT